MWAEKLKKSTTTDGQPAEDCGCDVGDHHCAAPGPIDPATGQHKRYRVLNDEERSKGFVRPVRDTYVHEKCGGETIMGRKLAETYAVDPEYYGATFCVICQGHFPMGEHGEFKWLDGSKVGT